MIDENDRKILELLQDNAKISNAELARRVGLAPSSVFERIKQLEAKGIIKKYAVQLDYDKLGCSQAAFILIKTTDIVGNISTAKLLAQIPEVQEVHHIAGEDCYIIKVRVENNRALAEFMRSRLAKIKTITSTNSIIVLETIKENGKIVF